MTKIENIKNTVICGDSLSVLKSFPDKCVDMVMTSPPYFGLRDYGTAEWSGGDTDCDHMQTHGKPRNERPNITNCRIGKGGSTFDAQEKKQYKNICKKCGAKSIDNQLGLETTIDSYISKLCDIFIEIHRVLKDEGSCYVNLGDSYAGSGKGIGADRNKCKEVYNDSDIVKTDWKNIDIQDKSLCLIPQRFAIEMVNRGWILRNCIIWEKPSCMPSSAKDRFTVSHEYIYFFVKQKKYWFEQQFDELAINSDVKYRQKLRADKEYNSKIPYKNNLPKTFDVEKKNKRAVWEINTESYKSYSGSHFAVFPQKLCHTPIMASCPEFICKKCGKPRKKILKKIGKNNYNEKGNPQGINRTKMEWKDSHPSKNDRWKSKFQDKGYTCCGCNAEFESGIVLDPFFGAGTTGVVALKLNRNFIGIDLNPEYIELSRKRLKPFLEQGKLF